MQNTKNELTMLPRSNGTGGNHGAALQPQFTPLEVDVSPSMSLISSTANHLHGLMIGLTKDKKDIDAETVKTVCECGKNIRELIRLQLDIVKVKHRV